MKGYAVYYSFFAEGVEQRELQDVYLSEEQAKLHNTMSKSELYWAGLTSVDVEPIDIIE